MKTKITALFLLLMLFTLVSFVRADDTISTSTETLLIRNGDTTIYQGIVDLPPAGVVDIADNTGTTHSVDADSVLGLLYSIDQASDAFSISDLQYYSSFGSFYLKCITPKDEEPSCDNWQYVVNGVTPWTGMDATLLSGGETIGLYFGNPHQLLFSTTSIIAGGSFVATAQKYNYLDDTWSPLAGATIGATTPNPDDPYNPTVVASSTTDVNGNATTTLADAGTYTVGIAEDYYFPSYTITVSSTTPPASSTPPTNSGGSNAPTTPPFSVSKAVEYLMSAQSSDGSFGGSALYTDWTAIALATAGASQAKIIDYMTSHNAVSSLPTDNERRAMALLALGENPYSFHGADYIAPIVGSFDGVQFGDASLVNDDIFALIPLASAGYSANDDIISKDIAFVLGRQQSDGSWEGSVDLTAAAVQALSSFTAPGASNALAKAGAYLQSSQGADGGWENIYSSSWAIQAMNALGASWTKDGKTTVDYLSLKQSNDGAALAPSETSQNRIWATSYAIPAAQGKPWSVVMHSVAKPAEPSPPIASGGNEGKHAEQNQATTTTATMATTTELASATSSIAPIPNSPTTPLVLGAAQEGKVVSGQTQEQDNVLLPVEKNFQSPLLAAVAENETNMPKPLVLGIIAAALSLWLLSRRFVKL